MKNHTIYRSKHRLGLLLMALVGFLPLIHAQEDLTIRKLSQQMSSSCVELEYKYSFRKSGVNMNGEGQLAAQGLCWKLNGNGIEMYCDSTSIWVIDPSLKEVIIEPSMSETEQGYEVNPAMLLIRMEDMFKLRDSVTSSDGKAVVYILDPIADDTLNYLNVEVLKSDSTIRQATIALKDGDLIKIEVSSMKLTPKQSVGYFRPQRTFDSSWIVTDLR